MVLGFKISFAGCSTIVEFEILSVDTDSKIRGEHCPDCTIDYSNWTRVPFNSTNSATASPVNRAVSSGTGVASSVTGMDKTTARAETGIT